ncbi:MAG TPA: hypothetical protein VD947_00990 [Patescibacteria group bacterium]|nr:hypothetical protein [Patescibacteria group bacterium]
MEKESTIPYNLKAPKIYIDELIKIEEIIKSSKEFESISIRLKKPKDIEDTYKPKSFKEVPKDFDISSLRVYAYFKVESGTNHPSITLNLSSRYSCDLILSDANANTRGIYEEIKDILLKVERRKINFLFRHDSFIGPLILGISASIIFQELLTKTSLKSFDPPSWLVLISILVVALVLLWWFVLSNSINFLKIYSIKRSDARDTFKNYWTTFIIGFILVLLTLIGEAILN